MLSLYPMMQSLKTSTLVELKAAKLLAELPAEAVRWQERAYAHYMNKLEPVAEYLPEPQKSWYLSGYRLPA
jgi:hypothetical protein